MFYNVVSIISYCLLPLIVVMMIAGLRVRSTFNRYNTTPNKSGLTADQVARIILDKEGLQSVSIRQCRGNLTDHYNPEDNSLYLSENVFGNSSVSAVGVACHEAGHAMQYANEYVPVKIRTAIVPIVNFTSRLSMPLIMIALVLELLSYVFLPLATVSSILMLIAIVCYAIYCIFTLITLPTEYNASARAKEKLIEYGFVDDEQAIGVKKVLNAAATTYLVSFALSLVQMLRLIMIFMSSRRRR